MTTTQKTQVTKDLKEKTVLIVREFDAPLANVWRAFTESELLDLWWAPAPWRAETKTMDFRVGGYWLYAMVSPENQKHWGRSNYLAIDHHKTYQFNDCFCDEQGVANTDFPVAMVKNTFTPTATGTRVEMKSIYPTEESLQKIIEMGFEQGITMCLDQLAVLFNTKRI
jgi:uncharacterized protein YndB with AHSA1/START domain